MTSISATAFRKNIYQTIAQVNLDSAPITITNSKGKNAILIGEDDWQAISETLYLNSIPGVAQSIIEGGKVPVQDCITSNQLEW
jgi:PHD/YefM family antitoxin component YafN of YafNO toxin-antitoxin module